MQFIEFDKFLAQRYRSCIHASFSLDVLQKYPNAAQILYETWYELEAKNTCPYKFRLEFDDPILEPSFVQTQVKYLSDTITNPSSPTKNPNIPWFKYWVELPFKYDKAPDFLFVDVPICYIFVSTVPQFYKPPTPPWMTPYVKDVPIFNLVISPNKENQKNTFFVTEVSVQAFFDFVIKVTHYEAANRLTSLREITERYIKDNWGGFKNSVIRLLGFGSRVNRNEIILKLKLLGDLFFGCGDFDSAFNYYQQLYQELQESDPPVADSLFIMFAITSMLTNSDIDVAALLDPILREKRPSFLTQIQSSLLCAYYSTYNCKPKKTMKFYSYAYSLIKENNLPYTFISYPMIMEAMSTIATPKKSSLFLMLACEFYSQFGLQKLMLILLWRIYHQIRMKGFPQLEQQLLLRIGSISETPSQLQKILINKNILFVKETTEQLRKLSEKKLIHIGSIIIHELIIPPTGFPQSPAPRELGMNASWSMVRKKLFPVIFHPSTEEFAATVWNDDQKLVNDYQVGLFKEHSIEFKMTPATADSECKLCDLKLYVEPEDSVRLETFDCIELKQKETKKMIMKFTPIKLGKFQIKGIKFFWFGVAPVFKMFDNSIRFDTVDNYPNATIQVMNVPKISYLNLPISFDAKVKMLTDNHPVRSDSTESFEDCYSIHSLDLVAESQQANVSLKKPLSIGFQQKWTLDNTKSEQDLCFEVTPTSAGIVTINLFISYTNVLHVTRFSHASLSFECKEVHKLKINQTNDAIEIHPNNDIEIVESNCADVSLNEKDGLLKVLAPVQSFTEEKCTISVKRNFTGTIMNDVLHINNIFFRFYDTVFQFTNPNQIIKVSFDAICLGKSVGSVTLNYCENDSFFLSGKSKYIVHGPAVNKISFSLVVLKPCEFDLGNLLKVDYAKSQSNISQIVRIE